MPRHPPRRKQWRAPSSMQRRARLSKQWHPFSNSSSPRRLAVLSHPSERRCRRVAYRKRARRTRLFGHLGYRSPRTPTCGAPGDRINVVDPTERLDVQSSQVKSSRAPLQVAYPSKTVLLSWLPEHIRATGLLFMDRLDTMSHDGPLQHTSDSAGAGARCWVTSNIRHPFELEFNLNWYSSRISIQSPTPRT